MGVQIYFENSDVRIYWDYDHRWMCSEYHRWIPNEQFPAIAEACLRAAREHPVTRWLSDGRGRGVVGPETQAHLVGLVQQLAGLGLQRMAVVFPTRSATAQISIGDTMEQYRASIEVQGFTTVDEAAEWLATGLVNAPPPPSEGRLPVAHEQGLGPPTTHFETELRPVLSTSVQVYFDTPDLRIYWDPDHRWMCSEYLGWCPTEEVAAGVEACLIAAREHRVTRWLSDSRNRRVVQAEAQLLLDRLVQQLAELGLQRMAIVLPAQSPTAQISVGDTLEKYRAWTLVRAFTSVEDAAQWLSAELTSAPSPPTREVASTS